MNHLLIWLALLSCASGGYFSKKNILIRSFLYKECHVSPGVVHIRKLNIATTADGDLVISGQASTAYNLSAPIEAKLKIYRRFLGVNIPLPCISDIGSCHYQDLCVFGMPADLGCPGALEENDIPCRCPISEGLYTLPGAQFSLPPTRLASLIAGHYWGIARLGSQLQPLACYRFTAELQ